MTQSSHPKQLLKPKIPFKLLQVAPEENCTFLCFIYPFSIFLLTHQSCFVASRKAIFSRKSIKMHILSTSMSMKCQEKVPRNQGSKTLFLLILLILLNNYRAKFLQATLHPFLHPFSPFSFSLCITGQPQSFVGFIFSCCTLVDLFLDLAKGLYLEINLHFHNASYC